MAVQINAIKGNSMQSKFRLSRNAAAAKHPGCNCGGQRLIMQQPVCISSVEFPERFTNTNGLHPQELVIEQFQMTSSCLVNAKSVQLDGKRLSDISKYAEAPLVPHVILPKRTRLNVKQSRNGCFTCKCVLSLHVLVTTCDADQNSELDV